MKYVLLLILASFISCNNVDDSDKYTCDKYTWDYNEPHMFDICNITPAYFSELDSSDSIEGTFNYYISNNFLTPLDIDSTIFSFDIKFSYNSGDFKNGGDLYVGLLDSLTDTLYFKYPAHIFYEHSSNRDSVNCIFTFGVDTEYGDCNFYKSDTISYFLTKGS